MCDYKLIVDILLREPYKFISATITYDVTLHNFHCSKKYGELSKFHGSSGTSKYYPILT